MTISITVLIAAALAPGIRRPVSAAPKSPELLKLTGDVEGVHDPVIIKEKDTYYVFCTGGTIRRSKDLHEWKLSGRVFEKLPDWAPQEIQGARGGYWAPDISIYKGTYRLYYAVSTFGKNNSAIGLVTNKTLDPDSPDYKWVDQGMVFRSRMEDDFNAIDANLAVDEKGNHWLNFGSFWGGIKMRKIDPETGKLASDDTTLYSLCSRPRKGPHQTPPVEGAVEAPFIIRHGGYFYLFVSYDFCCRGAKSDYNVVVGRSKKITGPYVDKSGKPLTEGAGTPVVSAATANWHGAGHEAVLQEKGVDYLLFHAYSATTGRPFLQISTMLWEQGWPRAATMP